VSKSRGFTSVVKIEYEGEVVSAKKCSKCSKVNPLTLYDKSKSGVGGVKAECKACASLRRKAHYAKHAEREREKGREYRENHPEKVAKAQRKYREKYKEELSERYKEYYEKNRQRKVTYSRRYYHENKEARHEYYLSRKDIQLDHYYNRLKLIKALPNTLSEEQRKTLPTYTIFQDIQEDHFIPVNTGHGGTTYENICLLSERWNRSKNGFNPFEWARYFLTEEERVVFYEIATDLANRNGLTLKLYKEFVNWCFENKRSLEEVLEDNEKYGYKKSSLDIWMEEKGGK